MLIANSLTTGLFVWFVRRHTTVDIEGQASAQPLLILPFLGGLLVTLCASFLVSYLVWLAVMARRVDLKDLRIMLGLDETTAGLGQGQMERYLRLIYGGRYTPLGR